MYQFHPVLTPELCQLFLTLDSCNGILSQTAKQLGEPKSTISKRLKVLTTGTNPALPRPWIRKTGKTFALTDEGKMVRPLVQQALEHWQALLEFVTTERQPKFRLACGQEAAGGIVLNAAKAFRQIHPTTELQIAVVRSRRRLEGLLSGLYNLALVPQDPSTIRKVLGADARIELLEENPLVLACAARSPWAKDFAMSEQEVTLQELPNWPLVLPESDAAIRLHWQTLLQRRQATSLRVAVEAGGWRVILGYVIAGFGVGLLPRSMVADVPSKLKWRPLRQDIQPANRLYAVSLPQRVDATLVEGFLAALRSVCSGNAR